MSKEQLLKQHVGAYTTARTVDVNSVFELSMHCRRLHDTATSILKKELSDGPDATTLRGAAGLASQFLQENGPEGLKPLVCEEMSACLRKILSEATSSLDCDYQVTVLLTWDAVGPHTPGSRGFDLFTFVQPLPAMEPMVAAEAHRATRNNPTIKDVQWITDRQRLEELQKVSGVNEIVMIDEDGALTEGLQSNFFAVTADGTLLTAPDERVLAGTVRKVALQVALAAGIPVRLECPKIEDASTWESCFVCSTSRLVKPIRELAAARISTKFPLASSLSHRIEDLVNQAIRENSECLPGFLCGSIE